MAAKESAAMAEAFRLITEEGLSAYAAAKRAGISRQAIYMSPWWKSWKSAAKPAVTPIK